MHGRGNGSGIGPAIRSAMSPPSADGAYAGPGIGVSADVGQNDAVLKPDGNGDDLGSAEFEGGCGSASTGAGAGAVAVGV